MRVICTTVRRGSQDYHISGRILEFELSTGKIVKELELPFDEPVYGPRGGNRGGRGIKVFNNKIYIAMHSRILIYDLSWNLLGTIQHPHVVGHHEIDIDNKGIWCCSTIVDAVIKLDFSGEKLFEFWASENDEMISWIGIQKITWDRNIDYANYKLPMNADAHPDKQLHINTVQIYNGDVYAYDCNHQALFRVLPTFKLIARNPQWDHAHNVIKKGRNIYVCNSANKTFEVWRFPLVMMKRNNLILKESVRVVEGEEKSTQYSKSGWIRGLIDLGQNEFIVGCNPASLHYISKGKVINRWYVSSDLNEAIHGLALKSRE